jgi:hypothetical protein
MDVSYACEPGRADVPNDDFVLAAEGFVIVLDGATAPAGVDSGCVHDVPWLVATLATHLARILAAAPSAPLREALRSGIAATMATHGPACDLTNRDSPSSTVALLRTRDSAVEYLVLGDSSVVLETHAGRFEVAHDDRTDHLPSYTLEAVRAARNTPGGFWIAGADPAAAAHALSGALPAREVRRAVLLTDGAARLVERYGRTWPEVLDLAEKEGPARVIADVREAAAAAAAGTHRGKRFDDATVVLCRGFSRG